MGEARRRKLAHGNTVASTDQAMNESPAGWPLTNPKEQARLEGQFQKLGIDFSKPGFHDSAAFLAVERVRPEILDDYARYVEVRTYSEAELQTAQRKIEVAAGVVSAAVKADGRHGLCVTASGVLSRMLDELGVWNFCVKGTMTVTFPPAVSGIKQCFYALDAGTFEAPHAFVVAPPFLVIDASVSAQSYPSDPMRACLPPLIMQRDFIPYRWKDDDIASPLVRMTRLAGTSVKRYLQTNNPLMLKRMDEFPARLAVYPGGNCAYVVTAIGGYAEKLADLTSVHTLLVGKQPIELFETQVLPQLALSHQGT